MFLNLYIKQLCFCCGGTADSELRGGWAVKLEDGAVVKSGLVLMCKRSLADLLVPGKHRK